MDIIMFVLAGVEAHPALTQALGIIFAAIIALIAARKAYQGMQEQIGANLALERLSKLHEQETIYRAFSADLDALTKALVGVHSVLSDDNETDEGLEICKTVFLATRFVVWESCAPKIGRLDKNHAANIVETYRFIDALMSRARALDFSNADHRSDLADFFSATIRQINRVLDGLPFRPDRENADPE